MSRYSASVSAALEGEGVALGDIIYSPRVFSSSIRLAYRIFRVRYQRIIPIPQAVRATMREHLPEEFIERNLDWFRSARCLNKGHQGPRPDSPDKGVGGLHCGRGAGQRRLGPPQRALEKIKALTDESAGARKYYR